MVAKDAFNSGCVASALRRKDKTRSENF
jgi:hypothetical protein